MDDTIRTNLENLRSEDRNLQNKAFLELLAVTDQPVDWAYELWDGLVADLKHKNNRVRAIAAQVLCNLAKSDPEKRMMRDFEALLAVTKDERFVTARHCLQALWKVGLAGQEQRQRLAAGLERRYLECVAEKNSTLIRFDILQSLRNVYAETGDEKLKAKALELIEIEENAKYRQKYASLWRGK